ncbi:MAG: hypothetical protein ABI591_23565 [Kofleriaceae bacterium]
MRALILLALSGVASARSYAVVLPTTALYTSTDPTGVIVHTDLPRVVRVVTPGVVWTEVVTDLSTTTSPEAALGPGGSRQCYEHPHASGLELHLFVKTAELAPVTTRDVAITFDDGTAVTLSRGVAIGPTDPHGDREVTLDGFRFHVAIANSELGTTFRDGAHVHPQRNGYDGLDDATAVSFDHQRRKFEVLEVAWPLYVDEVVELAGGGHLVTLDGGCGRFRLQYRGTLSNGDPSGGDGNWSTTKTPAYDTVVGTTAFWLDGSVAGKVVATTVVSEPAPSLAPDRRCFLAPFDGERSAPIAVCFATKDLHVR